MQTDADIILHGHLIEQADVLEGTGKAQLICLHRIHTGGILAIDHDGSRCGLVYLGKQVEHRSFTGTVGADQAGNLRLANGEIEIIHCPQTAEINPQMAAFQNRTLIKIPLRNDCPGGERNHFRIGFTFCFLTHAASPPFFSDFSRLLSRSVSKKFLMDRLLVISITAMRTTA